jgi:hypothetical protein
MKAPLIFTIGLTLFRKARKCARISRRGPLLNSRADLCIKALFKVDHDMSAEMSPATYGVTIYG